MFGTTGQWAMKILARLRPERLSNFAAQLRASSRLGAVRVLRPVRPCQRWGILQPTASGHQEGEGGGRASQAAPSPCLARPCEPLGLARGLPAGHGVDCDDANDMTFTTQQSVQIAES